MSPLAGQAVTPESATSHDMSSFVYPPLDVPKQLAENVWIVDGPIVQMALFGGKVPFPTRMTIVRLGSGDLWLHSPTEPNPTVFAAVEALGRVAHLVSPNRLHYAHIAAWKARYPDAIAWASPGVRERARSQRIEVAFDRDLGDAPPSEWAEELDQLVFRGSRFVEEVVFFHRSTRTLVLTDLIQNFERDKLPGWMWPVAKLGGVAYPDGKTPLDFRLSFAGRMQLARDAMTKMKAWHPERIVLSHGRCFEENGARELERAFGWVKA